MQGPLTREDLWSLPRVGAPSASDDGEVVVVPVTTHDGDEPLTRLHLLTGAGLEDTGSSATAADGARTRPLTSADTSASAPAVSPDGTRIAFTRSVEDDDAPGGSRAQLHVLPLDGGEARQVTQLALGVDGGATWADDATLLVVAEVPLDGGLDAAGDLAAERKERRTTGLVSDRVLTRFWDTWLPTDSAQHLLRLDLATDEVVDLTPDRDWRFGLPGGGSGIEGVDVQDGLVAFAAADLADERHGTPRWEIWTVPLDGSRGPVALTDVDERGGSRSRPRFLADDRVLHGRAREHDFYASPVDLFATAVDARTGQPGGETAVATALDHQPKGWEVAPDGRIVYVTDERGRSPLMHRRLDAPPDQPSEVLARGHTLGPPILGGDRVLTTSASLRMPSQVAEVTADGDVELLTDIGLDLLADRELAELHERTVVGHPTLVPHGEGDDLQVLVLTPAGWDADGSWPLVHLVHGGPHGNFGDTWSWRWNAQVLATAGYVVAMVNFHGSTSFGHALTGSISGDWMTAPVHDVLAATDDLVDAGWVDPDRMAIAGGSYGGYLVTQLATHTDRFACVVAHAAVTDFAGMYGSDVVHGLGRSFGAELFEDVERAVQASPHVRYEHYDTPTLVIHGDKDLRVPVTQGLALYQVLKAKGVRARLLHYPDENHWVLKKHNSLQWYAEFQRWIDEHVG